MARRPRPAWRWQFALIAVLLFVAGFSLPFADPDLSIHLATGEWVAKHHAVPFMEPFAWTRPGAPFQAYSWAIELLYFEFIEHFGPLGLNVLQGLIYVALAAVMVVLGRAARWNPWVIVVMVAAQSHRDPGRDTVCPPAERPALVTPLVWALVYRSLDTERLARTLAGLTAPAPFSQTPICCFPLPPRRACFC